MSALVMSRITRSAAVAVVAGGVIAFAVGHGNAAPASGQHTFTMITEQIADHQSGYYDIAADKDLQHGEVVGFDTTSCFINITTHVATCAIDVSRADGTFHATATLDLDRGTGTGAVTGGTRAFRGATGTVHATSLSQTKTKVTVTYHS